MPRRRQQTTAMISERRLDIPGVLAAARYEGCVRNTGDPPRCVVVGQETRDIRERPKFPRAGRESEGPVVPVMPVKAVRRKGALR